MTANASRRGHTAADVFIPWRKEGWIVSNHLMKRVFAPALLRATIAGSAFVGIGGMSLQTAPDMAIRLLWIWAGIIAAVTFLVMSLIFAVRRGLTSERTTVC